MEAARWCKPHGVGWKCRPMERHGGDHVRGMERTGETDTCRPPIRGQLGIEEQTEAMHAPEMEPCHWFKVSPAERGDNSIVQDLMRRTYAGLHGSLKAWIGAVVGGLPRKV